MDKRKKLDRNVQFLGFYERRVATEARIVSDCEILNSKPRGKDTQVHRTERHSPAQPFLQFRLDCPVVLIDIKGSGKNQCCRYDEDN